MGGAGWLAFHPRDPANRGPRLATRLALAAGIAILFAAGGAGGQSIDEIQFKAAFIYNVAKFVEWPPAAFKSPTDPLVSCILGDSPVESVLAQATSDKAIGGRKFVARQISAVGQAAGCHILFVSSSQRKRWRSMADAVKDRGVLTVGESEGFAADGGVINFKPEGDRIRIQVNLEAARREGLQLSSKLLSVSEIVKY